MLVHKKIAKKYMRYFFNLIHYFVVVFITLGAFLPKRYLFYFIFAWPLLYLHWKTNNNKCILTEIECWIDKQPYCERNHNDYPFITNLLSYFHIEIKNRKTKNNLIHYLVTFCWLIGMGRYYKVLTF